MSEMNGERALEVLIRKTRRFVRRSPFSPTVQYKLLKLRHTNFFSGFGLLSGAIRFWRKLIVEEQNHGGKSVKLIADEDRYVHLLFQLKSGSGRNSGNCIVARRITELVPTEKCS